MIRKSAGELTWSRYYANFTVDIDYNNDGEISIFRRCNESPESITFDFYEAVLLSKYLSEAIKEYSEWLEEERK